MITLCCIRMRGILYFSASSGIYLWSLPRRTL